MRSITESPSCRVPQPDGRADPNPGLPLSNRILKRSVARGVVIGIAVGMLAGPALRRRARPVPSPARVAPARKRSSIWQRHIELVGYRVQVMRLALAAASLVGLLVICLTVGVVTCRRRAGQRKQAGSAKKAYDLTTLSALPRLPGAAATNVERPQMAHTMSVRNNNGVRHLSTLADSDSCRAPTIRKIDLSDLSTLPPISESFNTV